jgi:hypothetical protein
MSDYYFDIITMHLVEIVGKNAWTMGNERKIGVVGFTKNFKEDPRAACADPERIEKAILELRDEGKEDPMATLCWRNVEIQVSLWNNGKSFEWVCYEY